VRAQGGREAGKGDGRGRLSGAHCDRSSLAGREWQAHAVEGCTAAHKGQAPTRGDR
jgi:hypothetical protein